VCDCSKLRKLCQQERYQVLTLNTDGICIFTTSSEKHYRVLEKILCTKDQASCMRSATLLSICDNIWCLGLNIPAWIHTKVLWVKAPFSVGGRYKPSGRNILWYCGRESVLAKIRTENLLKMSQALLLQPACSVTGWQGE